MASAKDEQLTLLLRNKELCVWCPCILILLCPQTAVSLRQTIYPAWAEVNDLQSGGW